MSELNLKKFSPRALWRWGSDVAPGKTFAERQYYALRLIFPGAIFAHFCYIFVFAYWDVWPVAIFNIVSVIMWLIAALAWRLKRALLSYFIGITEVYIHLFLVIVYVGWGAGVQYYILCGMVSGFLAPFSRTGRIVQAAFNFAGFAFLYHYGDFYPPLIEVDYGQLAVLNILNIAGGFGIVAGVILYFAFLVEQSEEELAAEHAKSEALLNNVLPTSIAARLKDDNEIIADHFPSASILFADIAGFTQLSQKITPKELVNILDTLFSQFDELVDKYGLEKIKTIGDNYMVASGIPITREDHAEALALFALEMRDVLARYNEESQTDFQIRVGINSGPVVAGVIGKRRFLYDLWGDSVNTASRMESHGEPGRIQVSEATRQLIGDRFKFTSRGEIDVKGKGLMQTYFLASD